MRREIFRRREAKIDLLQHYVFIGENNVDAAKRFLKAVAEDLKTLSAMPGIGRLREFGRPELADVRSWPVGGFQNYLIFYRATAERLEVLRVIHGAMDIDRIFEEPE